MRGGTQEPRDHAVGGNVLRPYVRDPHGSEVRNEEEHDGNTSSASLENGYGDISGGGSGDNSTTFATITAYTTRHGRLRPTREP